MINSSPFIIVYFLSFIFLLSSISLWRGCRRVGGGGGAEAPFYAYNGIGFCRKLHGAPLTGGFGSLDHLMLDCFEVTE